LKPDFHFIAPRVEKTGAFKLWVITAFNLYSPHHEAFPDGFVVAPHRLADQRGVAVQVEFESKGLRNKDITL
jgi:hypothetical protein